MGSRPCPRGVERLQEGMKKAGGPICPTAQRCDRRFNCRDLPLGGRRSPARGSAAVRENGSCPCLGEIAHDTHLVCCCLYGRPADIRNGRRIRQRLKAWVSHYPFRIAGRQDRCGSVPQLHIRNSGRKGSRPSRFDAAMPTGGGPACPLRLRRDELPGDLDLIDEPVSSMSYGTGLGKRSIARRPSRASVSGPTDPTPAVRQAASDGPSGR
jgi:hypothetical protein